MSETGLNEGDLDTTDLGQGGEAPAKRPHRSTTGSRGGTPGVRADTGGPAVAGAGPKVVRGPTSVKPSDVISGQTDEERETQAEERARKRRARAERERQEAANKIKEIVDGKVNPAMAMIARNILMVPPEVDYWMAVPVDEESGAIVVDSRGIPRYQYSPAAQQTILQPYEVEILTMIAPSLSSEAVTAKMEAFGKKAAPYAAVGAGLAFAASYAMRMRNLKVGLDAKIAAKAKEGTAETGE
jgi:hypothetical protein